MSLDVYLTKVMPTQVFSANITHNLGKMAKEAGLYECLWRPDEINVKFAGQIIEPLTRGIDFLKSWPDLFKKFDAPNGWGTYEQFLPWVEEYLQACIDNPDAEISVSR